MNKLTLILTLKLKIVTTQNLTLNDFYDALKENVKMPRVGFEPRMYWAHVTSKT